MAPTRGYHTEISKNLDVELLQRVIRRGWIPSSSAGMAFISYILLMWQEVDGRVIDRYFVHTCRI